MQSSSNHIASGKCGTHIWAHGYQCLNGTMKTCAQKADALKHIHGCKGCVLLKNTLYHSLSAEQLRAHVCWLSRAETAQKLAETAEVEKPALSTQQQHAKAEQDTTTCKDGKRYGIGKGANASCEGFKNAGGTATKRCRNCKAKGSEHVETVDSVDAFMTPPAQEVIAAAAKAAAANAGKSSKANAPAVTAEAAAAAKTTKAAAAAKKRKREQPQTDEAPVTRQRTKG
jgi:hypothetical protein